MLLSPILLVAQSDVPGGALDAFVTLRLADLDDAGLARISSRISREPSANIEYSCVQTGVIVLRLQRIQVSEKADIMSLVRRIFLEAGNKGTIDFLDIKVEGSGGNKC